MSCVGFRAYKFFSLNIWRINLYTWERQLEHLWDAVIIIGLARLLKGFKFRRFGHNRVNLRDFFFRGLLILKFYSFFKVKKWVNHLFRLYLFNLQGLLLKYQTFLDPGYSNEILTFSMIFKRFFIASLLFTLYKEINSSGTV